MQKNIMVCVTQQKTCEKLIRRGYELYESGEDNNLYVIHVVNENDKLLTNLSDGDALEYLFKITKELGAGLAIKRSKNVIKALVDYAVENSITHVVLGSSGDSSDSKSVENKLKRKLPEVEFII